MYFRRIRVTTLIFVVEADTLDFIYSCERFFLEKGEKSVEAKAALRLFFTIFSLAKLDDHEQSEANTLLWQAARRLFSVVSGLVRQVQKLTLDLDERQKVCDILHTIHQRDEWLFWRTERSIFAVLPDATDAFERWLGHFDPDVSCYPDELIESLRQLVPDDATDVQQYWRVLRLSHLSPVSDNISGHYLQYTEPPSWLS